MRKLCRLSLLLFISGSMILLLNVLLAALPVSAQTFTPEVNDDVLTLTAQSLITGQESVSIQAIDALTVTYSSPTVAGFPIVFTATVTTTMPPTDTIDIIYRWSFGDGTKSLTDNPVVSHTYAQPLTYTILVTAINSSDFTFATQTISILVRRPAQLFLPVVFKNFTPPVVPADLTCSLVIEPPNPSAGQPVLVIVDVENEGIGRADGFWIDLYVNPITPPASGRDNRIPWRDACGGTNSCSRGVAWSVSNAPLFAGGRRTFVTIPSTFNPVTGQGFDPANSSWESGIFSSGTYQFYAYVDSINGLDKEIDGAVKETKEDNNRCQGTLSVPAATLFATDSAGPSNLPER